MKQDNFKTIAESLISEPEQQYTVLQGGIERFKGDHFKCLLYIQRSQGQSFDWATKYGGWELKPTT
jgi:hypothetical protein